MASSLSAPLAAAATVDYPSSDGRPMAESDFQRIPLTYAVDRLRCHFRNHAEVYVSGNLLLYFEEGNPGARVAPDVFVVFGVRNVERSSYRLWEESKAPDFVLEITSRATWREDQTSKRELYRRLGVQEYWHYDPTRDYLEPPLQGLDLVDGAYERLPGRELADGTLALRSEVLGLELRLAGRRMRFHDPQTGEDLLDLTETEDRLREIEDQRRKIKDQRRKIEDQRRKIEDQRRKAEARVEQEAACRREAAARQAAETRIQQEAAARQAVEARVAELEALLHHRSDIES